MRIKIATQRPAARPVPKAASPRKRHRFAAARTSDRLRFARSELPSCLRLAASSFHVRQEHLMPKAYWVTTYQAISDADKLAAYAKLAPIAIAPFGGRYLARGTAAAAYEAGKKERIVISEFPSAKDAIAAYASEPYKAALRALGDGAVRDIRIVEGLE
jgi:uncharacterized protein (DUF1330 family)